MEQVYLMSPEEFISEHPDVTYAQLAEWMDCSVSKIKKMFIYDPYETDKARRNPNKRCTLEDRMKLAEIHFELKQYEQRDKSRRSQGVGAYAW